jgi:uncharacterized DUF497 family protein
MRFSWNAKKRIQNIACHQLDFIEAQRVFLGPTYTYQDDRFAYPETRFITLGFLKGVAVSIVHTESEHEIRIISFRKATKKECAILLDALRHG